MVKGKGSWEIHMIMQRSEKNLNSSVVEMGVGEGDQSMWHFTTVMGQSDNKELWTKTGYK